MTRARKGLILARLHYLAAATVGAVQVGEAALRERAMSALAFVGIPDKAHMIARSLPYGHQRPLPPAPTRPPPKLREARSGRVCAFSVPRLNCADRIGSPGCAISLR